MDKKELKITLNYLIPLFTDPEEFFRKVVYEEEKMNPELIQVTGCKWEIPRGSSNILNQKAKNISSKLDSYLDRFERVQPSLNLVCQDLGLKNPYTAEIDKLKKGSILSPSEEKNVKGLLELGEHSKVLRQIKRFLVDLPEEDGCSELRFLQNLLRESIHFPDLLAHPEFIERQVLTAFDEYKRLYIKYYTERCNVHRKKVKDFFQKQNEIEKILVTLNALDEIPLLGPASSKVLEARWKKLKARFSSCASCRCSDAEVKMIVSETPECSEFAIMNLGDDFELKVFYNDLKKVLEDKISIIRMNGVQKIISSSGESSVKKLTSLLSVAKIKDIVEIFDKKNTPIIISELKKILDSTSLGALHLGDFSPTIDMVKTEAEIEKVSKEFKKFLKEKIASSKNSTSKEGRRIVFQ